MGAFNTVLSFYDIFGQRIATASCGPGNYCAAATAEVYFGAKLVRSNGVAVVTDRLGSVRGNSSGDRFSYLPYGEERTITADHRVKFGTYVRDSTGLTSQDYADQRYDNPWYGRFNSPDRAQGNPTDPKSWNKYAYTLGDPVNFVDADGRCTTQPDTSVCFETNSAPAYSFPFIIPGLPDIDFDVNAATQVMGLLSSITIPPVDPAILALSAPAVDKNYGGYPIPCNGSAKQLMSAVESDFASFGNFSGTFGDGLASGQVQFSPPPGQLQAGQSIGIQLSAGLSLPGGGSYPLVGLNTSVTVTSVGQNGLSFATVPGHLLYPASIFFGAADLGNGNIGFAINIKGTLPNIGNASGFIAGGSAFEDAQWNGFLGRVADWCNKFQ